MSLRFNLACAAGLVLGISSMASAAAVGSHQVDFLGVSYNPDGTSTWTYSIMSDDDNKTPALSHWILQLCDHAVVVSPIDTYTTIPSFDSVIGRDGIVWDVKIGPDPTTGVDFGIKFEDASISLGEDGAKETDIFQFTLDKHYVIDDVAVAIKAGQTISTAMVSGPSLSCTVVPVPAAAWGGLALLGLLGARKLKR